MRLVGITPANQRLIENADGISRLDWTERGLLCDNSVPFALKSFAVMENDPQAEKWTVLICER